MAVQPMFNVPELQETILLHRKSYELLRWVAANLRKQTLSFSVAHKSMTTAEAANEWVRRHQENIPPSARPEPVQIEKFSSLFVSYLQTSFELREQTKLRVASSCRCYCDYCTYLVRADQLQLRNPTKRARAAATELKRIYLLRLLTSLDHLPEDNLLDQILATKDEELLEAVSVTTYAHELIRRTKFASQGEGVLVLWREIPKIRIKPGKRRPVPVEFNAQRVLTAEAALIDRLRQLARS